LEPFAEFMEEAMLEAEAPSGDIMRVAVKTKDELTSSWIVPKAEIDGSGSVGATKIIVEFGSAGSTY
jgi:hypothetical protein